ncbi:MAG: hypothetical protein HLUCCA12_02810 [Rhodobacteraceae bacterium HLUCCA12]|nr:MAG: hypothetical protein HLUCCA12_02810 [Rhodobacteraceae bacterium HLUCCA12]
MLGLAALTFLPQPAPAQSAGATTASAPAPRRSLDDVLRLPATQRTDVEAALRDMPPERLYLTFARIHAAFRLQIGKDDLRLARALVDYALLTERELRLRGLSRPESTESAAEMLLLYELVL